MKKLIYEQIKRLKSRGMANTLKKTIAGRSDETEDDKLMQRIKNVMNNTACD